MQAVEPRVGCCTLCCYALGSFFACPDSLLDKQIPHSGQRELMFDPLHKWLGIPPSEQPPNDYQLLRIADFESDVEVIDGAADRQLAFLHGLANGDQSELAEELSNRVSAARLRLLNRNKKAEYDQALRTASLAANNPVTSTQVQAEPTTPALRKSAPAKNWRESKPRSRTWHYSVLPGAVILLLLCMLIAMGKLRLDRDKMVAIGIPEEVAESVAGIDPEESTPDSSVGELESEKTNESTATRHPSSDAPSKTSSIAQHDSTESNARPSSSTHVRLPTVPTRPSSSKTSAQPSVSGSTPQRRAGQPVKSGIAVASQTAAVEEKNEILAESVSGPAKPLIPSAGEIEVKMNLVRDLYQENYRTAETKAQKIALANQLLSLVEKTENDPAGKFALLRVARDIFMGEHEYESALTTVAQMSLHFREVDEIKHKSDPLAALNRVGVGKSLEYADAVLSVAHASIDAGKFQVGQALLDIVPRKIPGGIPSSRSEEFEGLGLDFENAEKLFRQYETDASLLEANPENKAASTSAGRYLCLIENNWTDGLSYLAKGSDEKLRHAASLESSQTPGMGNEVELGEAWYAAATAEVGPLEKRRLYDRALRWFLAGKAGSKGLGKLQVESRVKEILPLTTGYLRAPAVAGGSLSVTKQKPGDRKIARLLDQKIYESTVYPGSRARILPGPRIFLAMGTASLLGECCAGLELENATRIRVVGGQSKSNQIASAMPSKTICFFVDYHTPSGYSKRICLQTYGGLTDGSTDKPDWGCGQKPDRTVRVGASGPYQFDLKNWAPPEWDGKCWFSIYMKHGGRGQSLQAVVSWAL